MTEQRKRLGESDTPGLPSGSYPNANSGGQAPKRPSTGLKLVTISPAVSSIPDVEESSASIPRPSFERVDPYLGCTIDGRYKVEEVLGEGGMGVVYLCRHKIIGKKVAMKVLRADLARDGEATERFLNEAKAASAIGNPHIIDISDFGQLPDGSTYFVMEYLEGMSLSHIVENGQPVPVARILPIARQLAEALGAAHRAGIVHRDLKPDNIYLITRGSEKDFVKILDFGIAKVSSDAGKLTRAGVVFGTPHYMSPEQAAGSPVDHRCDVYSLGVILYELASGRVPFDADNFMGILTQHMYKAPVPIRALVPQPQEVPPGLEAIVLKCLSKRPEQRYESMDELAAELDKLLQGVVPNAVPEMMNRSGGFNVPADYFKVSQGMPMPMPAAPDSLPLKKTRWPLWAGLAGVLTAVILVAAIFAKSAPSTASTAAQRLPPAQPKAAAPSAPVVEPLPEPIQSTRVAIATEPADAHVFRGSEDLGTPPVLVDVETGQTLVLSVRRDGYKTAALTLDGTETKRLVRLAPEKTAVKATAKHVSPKPAAKPAGAKPKPKGSLGGGEIVNPWE